MLTSRNRYNHGLWAGRPGFDSRKGQEFSLLYGVQTGSEAHPASYPMGTVGVFTQGLSDNVARGPETDH
jgi:hypothetical protein